MSAIAHGQNGYVSETRGGWSAGRAEPAEPYARIKKFVVESAPEISRVLADFRRRVRRAGAIERWFRRVWH